MKQSIQFKHKVKNAMNFLGVFFLVILASCAPNSTPDTTWDNVDEEGAFIVHRRQSPIGEETYTIKSNDDGVIVKSLQGENERGRITGVEAELRMTKDLVPTYYSSRRLTNKDTTNIFKMEISDDNMVSIWEKHFDVVTVKAPDAYFPLHSNIPAAMEMMLYHYCFKNDLKSGVSTLPRGEVSITHKGQDVVEIKGKKITLDRYVVEGINWGGRTVWLDESKNLIALVKANTQIREMIRKGYEEALPVFIAGNVTEQMDALSTYTKNLKKEQATITALVGGDIVDGFSEETKKNMTLLIENGKIKSIGKSTEIEIPEGADVIDVKGKTLIPGLWDMHAHSNQVQWAPAYLAGGVTTIRDNGNELEFATAFRDAIANDGALGPDIILAGMTDGPGAKGNGVVRATSPEQAKEVVAMYHKNGYKQIKVYTSIAPDILKILADEAHKVGMTVTGHVPALVNNANDAVESGMDMLSHSTRILAVLFPDKKISELGANYMAENEITDAQINNAIAFFLKHGTVLDPTLGLSMIRTMPRGEKMKTIEPDAERMAYELFEGKLFRSGVSEARAKKAKENVIKSLEVIGKFFKAGVPVVAGTDNFAPGFGLFLEIEIYQKYGGLTPLEAIRTATIIPAEAMGMGNETGTLEVGKEADIAILDKNPLIDISNIRTVTAVITNGNYYESEPLWIAADFKPTRD
ncbi:amidohydrolase family protein [Aureibaculum sp. A20]|uniref:Amidohydrolase family protein n=1 Tax=Aureibaculum flavum TaxID=2795986 RepID=A0ABS0WNX0_9FLAO|nr:amidohydrolase family protein [Aureibaculum flavum]MBJ2173664.1 amidohydrolase family protein [Aureibaculum flavum]